jgi:Zn-dependent protease with chaperone function
VESVYPPGPKNVPADFTKPSMRYRWKVVFVLGSLLLTLALYLALIAVSGWGFYQLLTLPWPPRLNLGVLFVRSLGMFCAGLLFLYLFKGLFKRQGAQRDGLVEITGQDQPDVFAFVRQLCVETGAPLPQRIYVSHEVNACVFYPSSLLSLIIPGQKNLLIGLGLVQTLNLTELKAVLAHELGHFSQSSMRLGNYVYVANKVLADIVYGRDFFDRFLSDMKSWDPRVAIFANVFLALLGYVRLVFEMIFKGLNLLNLSLSREMEFNADRFAVKVAGSDAVGQVLERCNYADEAWAQLEAELWAAGDHRLYSKDIFAHFEGAARELGRRRKDPNWGIRPSAKGPQAFIFSAGKDHAAIPEMWSTHPANDERERHAKEIYLPAETDSRSAWLLFRSPEALREAVSRSFYETVQHVKEPFALTDAQQVQHFLNDEYAEMTYAEKYAGFYDDRFLELKDLHCLPTQVSYLSGSEAVEDIEAIHASMTDWMSSHRRRQEEEVRLERLLDGAKTPAEPTIEFRGQAQPIHDVPMLLNQVQGELENDRQVRTEADARTYLAHKFLAQEVGCAAEFEQRYQFHVQIQDLHQKITEASQIAGEVLHFADDCNGEMSEEAFGETLEGLREAVSRLNEVSMTSTRFRIPALKNITQGPFLSEFLTLGELMDDLRARDGCIEGEWIDELLARLAEVADKLQRLHFKSLGAILGLQETIVRKWGEKPTTNADSRPAATAKRPWH